MTKLSLGVIYSISGNTFNIDTEGKFSLSTSQVLHHTMRFKQVTSINPCKYFSQMSLNITDFNKYD